MASWTGRWFGYGLGRALGKALFGDGGRERRPQASEPIRNQTEAEILADEKRFDEDEKRLDEESPRG